jgi:hypothetical protein
MQFVHLAGLVVNFKEGFGNINLSPFELSLHFKLQECYQKKYS